MTQKYDLLYVPIDLPQSINKKEILESFSPKNNFHVWNFQKLTYSTGGKYGPNNLKEEYREIFPSLCQFIDQLPFTNLSNAKINLQTSATKMHVDFVKPQDGQRLLESITGNEPCGYRIVIKGRKDVIKIKNNDQIVTAMMPEDTDCYVINQSSCEHLVLEDPGRITVYVTGFMDKESHSNLISKSLDRFGDYAIWKTVDTKQER